MNDFVLAPGFTCDVPRLMDYFGLWQILPDNFRPLVNQWNGVNVNAHIVSQSAMDAVKQQSERQFYSTREGVAIFQVQGPMMKAASSMSGGTSTVRLRQQIRQARQDDSIVAGMLQMDTPGGAVKGNSDLADEVARFAAEKPIIAFVEDLTASAGVSVASQATKIVANNGNAMYGAMGTYSVLIDQSRAAENLGLKVHVIKAGDFKGMGEPGAPLTEQQLAEAERIVTTLNEQYLATIAGGRKRTVESLRPFADGRVIFAADALAAGLIDGIATFSESMDQLLSMSKAKPSSAKPKTKQVIQTTTPPAIVATAKPKEVSRMEPATLQELESQFPGADASWILAQLKSQATLLTASQSYAKHVQEVAKAEVAKAQADAAKAIAEAQADAAKAASEATAKSLKQTGSLGAQPLTLNTQADNRQQTGNPVEDFHSAVANYMHQYKCSREEAMTAVRRNNRSLTQAFLLATNPSMHATRVLTERMDAINRAEKLTV